MKYILIFLLSLLVSCSSPKGYVKQPDLIPILYQGNECYQLRQDWYRDKYKVPKRLVIDGASVPRVAWIFMPPDGLHRPASLWHDWLYINRGTLPEGLNYTKEFADAEFYTIMRECGVSKTRASIAYRAVKHFGHKAWNSIEDPIFIPLEEEDDRIILLHIYGNIKDRIRRRHKQRYRDRKSNRVRFKQRKITKHRVQRNTFRQMGYVFL